MAVDSEEQKDEIIVLQSILEESQIKTDVTDNGCITGCITINPSFSGEWITVTASNGGQQHSLTVNTRTFDLYAYIFLVISLTLLLVCCN